MPYELSFIKPLEIQDDSPYYNDCCWGGDHVSDVLLPPIRARYRKIQAAQEDWGWFIWITGDTSQLAIDVFCDDPKSGAFRIHLMSRKRYWGLEGFISDTPELEELRETVVRSLSGWAQEPIKTERLNAKFKPIGA